MSSRPETLERASRSRVKSSSGGTRQTSCQNPEERSREIITNLHAVPSSQQLFQIRRRLLQGSVSSKVDRPSVQIEFLQGLSPASQDHQLRAPSLAFSLTHSHTQSLTLPLSLRQDTKSTSRRRNLLSGAGYRRAHASGGEKAQGDEPCGD